MQPEAERRAQRFSMRGGSWKCKECREPINDGIMVHQPGCSEGAPAGDDLADWVMAGRDRYGNAILRYRPTDGLYRVLPVEES